MNVLLRECDFKVGNEVIYNCFKEDKNYFHWWKQGKTYKIEGHGYPQIFAGDGQSYDWVRINKNQSMGFWEFTLIKSESFESEE